MDAALKAGAPAGLGRYDVFGVLGRGGMADVFVAVARGPMGFNKLVVIKRLRPALAEEPGFRDMFLDEARLAARLSHPNVVHTYEVGESEGSFFIAMEYLDGQPLNRILSEMHKSGQRLEAPLAARIASDALAGLHYAHELKDFDGTPLRIIHRDVSPHNVFVTYEGQAKLVDFGIAKAAMSRTETEVGVLKGKVAYMAPEQAMAGPLDARADVFAMGIVLWEMIAGRPLFAGENAANTLHRLMNEPVPAPSSLAKNVDPRLEAIAMRALEKEPSRRWQTAREMKDALDAYLKSEGHTRQEDVGARVSALFSGMRAQVQTQIKNAMANLGRQETPSGRSPAISLASIEQIERAGGNVAAQLVRLDDGAPLDAGSGSITLTRGEGFTSGAPFVSSTKTAERERSRRRALWGGLALVMLLVAIGVGTIVMGGRRANEGPAASAAPSASIAEPVAAAPSVTVEPSAAPSEAAAPIAIATAEPVAPATPRSPRSPRGPRHPPSRPVAPSTTAAPTSGPPGFLTFDTYPWTRVSENGRAIGTTPLVHVTLDPGPHTLTLENTELGIRQSYAVTITSGQLTTRRLGLR